MHDAHVFQALLPPIATTTMQHPVLFSATQAHTKTMTISAPSTHLLYVGKSTVLLVRTAIAPSVPGTGLGQDYN